MEWPRGKIEVTVTPARHQTADLFGTVEMLGNPAPCYLNLSIQIDRGNRMIAYDGQGRERWHISLHELGSMRGDPPRFVRSLAFADGELLLFSVGLKLAAISVPESGVEPSVRWILDMADPNVSCPDRSMPLPPIVVPWHFYLDQSRQPTDCAFLGRSAAIVYASAGSAI